MQTTIPSLPLNIAPTKEAFMEALFTGPKTFDGYVGKSRKNSRGIPVFYQGEDYILNSHDVFCYATKVNGRTWYNFGGKLNRLSFREKDALVSAIRASR